MGEFYFSTSAPYAYTRVSIKQEFIPTVPLTYVFALGKHKQLANFFPSAWMGCSRP